MATTEWRKPPAMMAAEATATLRAILAGATPPAALAGAIIIAAHQVPELVEAGLFRAAELDDAGMEAMAVIVDIAADWEDEVESLDEFLATFDEEDYALLNRAARPWAAAVLALMVP
jgi:hypothetical protein